VALALVFSVFIPYFYRKKGNRMLLPRRRDDAGKGCPLFLATLWMAICVALLCALAPLGPPSSKLMGSAFNPATTAVVLKARSPAGPQVNRVIRPDGEGLKSLPYAVPLSVLPILCGFAISLCVLHTPNALALHFAKILASTAIGHRPPARAPPLS